MEPATKSIKVRPSTHREARRLAEVERRTASEVIARAVERYAQERHVDLLHGVLEAVRELEGALTCPCCTGPMEARR